MKKLIYVFILLLLVGSVYAGLDDELSGCGDNIRCVYRVAAKYDSLDACDSLKGGLVDSCKGFIERQSPEPEVEVSPPVVEKEVVAAQPSEESGEQFGALPFSVGVVLVLVFFFVIFVLFERYRHHAFLKDNAELINYIKDSLDSGTSEGQIKKKLEGVGWKDSVIDKVFREVKR